MGILIYLTLWLQGIRRKWLEADSEEDVSEEVRNRALDTANASSEPDDLSKFAEAFLAAVWVVRGY